MIDPFGPPTNVPVHVTLTLTELRQAGHVAVERKLRAIDKKRREPHGRPVERGDWDVVIAGVATEVAVAKALNLFWHDDPRLDYHGDVGPYQVRSTDLPHGCLTLYPKDRDDKCFILVVDATPRFTIVGFMLAGEGKRDEYLSNGRLRDPGWLVPQADLLPIQELPR